MVTMNSTVVLETVRGQYMSGNYSTDSCFLFILLLKIVNG